MTGVWVSCESEQLNESVCMCVQHPAQSHRILFRLYKHVCIQYPAQYEAGQFRYDDDQPFNISKINP